MKHILFDLKGCDADLLDDYRFVRNTLFHAAILSNSRILKIDFHQFTPQGVTGFALLADSHISIHTWTINNVAKCDIFTCSEKCTPQKAVEYMKEVSRQLNLYLKNMKEFDYELDYKNIDFTVEENRKLYRIGRENKECY